MNKAKMRKIQHSAAARREKERTALDLTTPQQHNRAARRLMNHALKRGKLAVGSPSDVASLMSPSARWAHPALV